MSLLFRLLCALLTALLATASALRALHLFQLESYQIDGYDRARKRKSGVWRDGLDISLIGFGIALVFLLVRVLRAVLLPIVAEQAGFANGAGQGVLTLSPLYLLVVCAAQAAAGLLLLWRRGAKKAKKPLAYTKRMKRLIALVYAVNLILSIPVCFLTPAAPVLLCVLPLLQAWIVKLAAYAAQPVESRINKGFFRDAQGILEKRPELIKIGITGSYGKTSTKFILAGILAEKYNVLATPSSFNTPMGLTRVIREQLRPEHQVFLAEMGARHAGDIAELCDLVHPTVGVLTSIGPQHLETFFSLDRVAATKFELIDRLPSSGNAFFAAQVVRDWKELAIKRDDITRTIAGTREGSDYRAFDITVTPDGSDFSLRFPDGDALRMHTKLLGAHNIDNITLCCAVAHHLGLSGEQIARGVAKIEPVEHRLQLLRGAAGSIVIDDAFNSNPAGAKAALDVLGSFHGRKVIVTPGMVELGEREEELNRVFGEQIAGVADVVILIGEARTKPIADGLYSRDFFHENVHVVPSLEVAAKVLARIAKPGDITLFENDLPDNYES